VLGFHDTAYTGQQFTALERLSDKIGVRLLSEPFHHLLTRITAHEEYRHLGVDVPNALCRFQSIQARHIQIHEQ